MHILAVDTSGGVCSAAVARGGAVLSEAYMNAGRTHSEALAPMIDFCLSGAGLGIRDVGLFACAVGPGSFTGLRIGVGMIKAFAHASGKPALGVMTLDALARNLAGTDETVCPLIDARRGEVYTATYLGGSRLTDYRAERLDSVLDALRGRRVVFLGDAALKYEAAISVTDAGFRVAHGGVALQRAGSVALAAYELWAAGVRQDAHGIEPFYLRETQAERVRRAQRGV